MRAAFQPFSAALAAAVALGATSLAGSNLAAEPAGPTISTIAGSGQPSSPETPKKAPLLEFAVDNPFGIEPYSPGVYYGCSFGDHRILRLDLNEGIAEVVGGTGMPGYSGDGGPAAEAAFNRPHEIRRDQAGAIYVADTFNNVVRRIDPKTGVVTTIAGTGEAGFSGDGGPATQATMRQPHSIALDGAGGLYVADIGNHRIRRVDLAAGTIETIAGTGEKKLPTDGGAAKDQPVLGPRSLYCVGSTLYVALREGHSVWSLDLKDDRWLHIAGSGKKGFDGDGGNPLQATFDGPKGIVVDKFGKIYVVDTENHAVRVVNPRGCTIRTLAGKGPDEGRYSGDGGPAGDATLKRPHGICLTPEGDVLVGDSENHRFRKIDLP